MNFNRIEKINISIQQWLTDNKRIMATPEMVLPTLEKEGFYVNIDGNLKAFIEEINGLPKKVRRDLLNIRTLGKEIRFHNKN